MTIATLRRRLGRIQARCGTDRITQLVNLAGHPAEAAAEAVRDWRIWTADGRARRTGSTLFLHAPTLTVAEWSARYAPPVSAPR